MMMVVAAFSITSEARAEEEAAEKEEPSSQHEEKHPAHKKKGDKKHTEEADDQEEEEKFHPVTLTVNPLSLLLTRIGANVEWLPAKHHAIELNPFGWFTSTGDGAAKTDYTSFGGELQYKFYSGKNGANGFFVGPFVTYINLKVKTAGAETTTSSYGAGLDVGAQHIFDSGFTIGGGFGFMYLNASTDSRLESSSTVKFKGTIPRLLFTVGWSF